MSTVKEWMKNPKTGLILLIFMLCTLSFALGYLYAREENPAPILIQKVVKL